MCVWVSLGAVLHLSPFSVWDYTTDLVVRILFVIKILLLFLSMLAFGAKYGLVTIQNDQPDETIYSCEQALKVTDNIVDQPFFCRNPSGIIKHELRQSHGSVSLTRFYKPLKAALFDSNRFLPMEGLELKSVYCFTS